MTKKRNKLPTILGIVVLLLGTFFGVFLINSRQIFRLGAEGETSPKDIRVSNVTDTSLTISWVTDVESAGFVVWGASDSTVNSVEKESDLKSFTHSVTIDALKPETRYFYKINSDGALVDNKGIPWQTATGASLGLNKNSLLISGSVLTATGQPVKKSLVYANIGGYLFSTLSSDTGNYVFQLASTRSSNLSSYLQVSESQTPVEIFVQAGALGISSAQIFPQSAKPAPPLILGQTHDFRSLPASKSDGVPTASVDLPTDSEADSKFSVPDDINKPTSSAVVTLENIDEGESVTSTQPEFFGDGPTGTTLTIKVESENPITEEVKVASNGSWKWTPPEGLAAGVHKITITWKDINGITRSLTRNFVVQAGEAPAFEASNSATTTTSTPTATATAKSTATSTAKATTIATSPPTPETGSLTPTMLFTILGLGVTALSFAIWKYADA
jgi:hypothetical protein